MANQKLLEIIKIGIKGELDSITLYQGALDQAEDNDIKSFLQSRIKEEKLHYNYLVDLYKQIDNGTEIEAVTAEIAADKDLSPMITPRFIEEVAKKQVIFSAFSTATLLEKNAMDFYKKAAEEVDTKLLSDFFLMMSEWEGKHYDDLINIQKDAEEKFWSMNQFSPF